ncbi:elongation factor P [Novosphingobium piscinae]|uniref:Elongation factor P n=1 Tax=Novosphingobium piscinae TaxID=1507448 RepID=A0A7X1FX92_9SPHN|nr:elongation factor P [Novosphingobium piscinae]MBC2668559.1 elongation factor P [Novosphingobium piscinae]
MSRRALFCSLVLLALPVPLVAAPGGPIGVLPLGRYACELPGDVEGPVGVREPAADFTVTYGSTYRTPAGKGTYLLTGDRVSFTSGPIRGAHYQRTGTTFLRQTLPDGTPGRLRCVRQGGLSR